MEKLPSNKTIVEAICVHHALRSFGFRTDDIFITLAPAAHRAGALHVFCELRAQGKTFMVDCGPSEDEPAAFQEMTRKTCEAIVSRAISDEELGNAWQKSAVRPRVGFLAAAIMRAGFELSFEGGSISRHNWPGQNQRDDKLN